MLIYSVPTGPCEPVEAGQKSNGEPMSITLVVVNSKRHKQKVNIEWNQRDLPVEFDAESVATLRLL